LTKISNLSPSKVYLAIENLSVMAIIGGIIDINL